MSRRASYGCSKYVARLVVVVLFCAMTVAGAQERRAGAGRDSLTTIFTYGNFSDLTGLTLNGNAQQSGSVLLVGPASTDQIGSAYYTTQVNVAQGFLTEFNLQIIPDSNSYTTADGMAFIIQNQGVNALGYSTGHPGYGGIRNSIAVEFDTFQNYQLSDPNNNHIGLQSCGTAQNSIDHANSCDLALNGHLPLTLADGNVHKVQVSYMPGAGGSGPFVVAVDGKFILKATVNLSTLLSLNGNDAWVGFTAGSGAAFEYGEVTSWTFATMGE